MFGLSCFIILKLLCHVHADRIIGKLFLKLIYKRYCTVLCLSLLLFFCLHLIVGAIFDDGSFLYEAAFNVALKEASEDEDNPFVPNVLRTAPEDILEAENAFCSILEVTHIYKI